MLSQYSDPEPPSRFSDWGSSSSSSESDDQAQQSASPRAAASSQSEKGTGTPVFRTTRGTRSTSTEPDEVLAVVENVHRLPSDVRYPLLNLSHPEEEFDLIPSPLFKGRRDPHGRLRRAREVTLSMITDLSDDIRNLLDLFEERDAEPREEDVTLRQEVLSPDQNWETGKARKSISLPTGLADLIDKIDRVLGKYQGLSQYTEEQDSQQLDLRQMASRSLLSYHPPKAIEIANVEENERMPGLRDSEKKAEAASSNDYPSEFTEFPVIERTLSADGHEEAGLSLSGHSLKLTDFPEYDENTRTPWASEELGSRASSNSSSELTNFPGPSTGNGFYLNNNSQIHHETDSKRSRIPRPVSKITNTFHRSAAGSIHSVDSGSLHYRESEVEEYVPVDHGISHEGSYASSALGSSYSKRTETKPYAGINRGMLALGSYSSSEGSGYDSDDEGCDGSESDEPSSPGVYDSETGTRLGRDYDKPVDFSFYEQLSRYEITYPETPIDLPKDISPKTAVTNLQTQ